MGGKAGNDELYGDEGNDALWGDDGDDLLRGGPGSDILVGDNFSGASGSDTFVLASGEGTDLILDFETGIDTLALAGDLTFDDLMIIPSNGTVTVAVGTEVLAFVQGVNTLSAADFS